MTLKHTDHRINSHQTIDTQIVKLKLTPVHSGGSCLAFVVKPYVRTYLNVGTEVDEVDSLLVQNPHLELNPLKGNSFGYVEMILGQNMFYYIRPTEYFETNRTNTSIAVRLPLVCVLSSRLPSTSGLFPTCFKVVIKRGSDSKLADQNRNCYHIDSYGAYKQVDPRSAAGTRAENILQETKYND